MPTNLRLVSPWKSNRLPGDKSPWPANYAMRRSEFCEYLRQYATDHALPIISGVGAAAVERASDGWRVRTRDSELTCRLLVNATGYFSNPLTPDVPGMRRSSVPHAHVAEYGDPARVSELIRKPTGNILIVGKRLSAGQTMLELHDAGFDVSLSHRAPIEFGTNELGWWFFFRVFPYLEWLRLKRAGAKAVSTPVRMPGGRCRELVLSGKVKCLGEVREFGAEDVAFADDRREQFDLVIFATGFRPALQHLEPLGLETHPSGGPVLNDLESVSARGLFFIGLDHGRNFQSRFVRGIRNDAAFLAEQLRRRLEQTRDATINVASGCS